MPGVVKGLREAGLHVEDGEYANFFAWAALPEGVDEEVLVRDAADNGIQLTPGSVFFTTAAQGGWLRVSAASGNDPRLFDYLRQRIAALTTATALRSKVSQK